MKMKKIEWFILFLILLGAFFVRLYRFDNPIADWHSWRQADTSAVSRNFVTKGFDILHPRFDDLSNVPSGMDNPNGYRFVEFPIYNIAQGGLFKLFGGFTLEEWGRLITIIVSTLSTLLIFLLVRRHSTKRTGLFAALVFGLIPYNIYYGRVILPDTSMVGATLAGIYFFDKWIESIEGKTKKIHHNFYTFLVLTVIFCSVALLLKPFAAFFFLPILVLAWNRFGIHLIKKWELWMYALLTVVPLILWRVWINHYPEGIPVNNWLFNGNGIRFRPAFFRWIFYERITKLISGYAGALLLVTGVLGSWKLKERWYFYSYMLASFLYVTIVATGNVQHDYYQIPIIPSIAIAMAIGAEFFIEKIRPRMLGYGVITVVFVVSFFLAWNQIKDYFNINNWAIVKAGQAVDTLTPKNAKIIAPYDGDTSFLYQTKRQGWPSFEHPTEELIKMGASYLVIVNPQSYDYKFGKTYKIVKATPDYILFDLTKHP